MVFLCLNFLTGLLSASDLWLFVPADSQQSTANIQQTTANSQ